MQPFIPSLASKTTFLCEQVTNWDWNPSTNQSFHCLKSHICNTLLKTTLAYYNHTQPLVLRTDASEYGLGTALLQNNRPIAFASKTLTDVETRYMNIERECLSVCYGLEKFHTYVYGKHVTVQNDHKPLEMIQRKPICTCCTTQTSVHAPQVTTIQLHNTVCTRSKYGLGRQIVKISFTLWKLTNRVKPKYPCFKLSSWQVTHNSRHHWMWPNTLSSLQGDLEWLAQ